MAGRATWLCGLLAPFAAALPPGEHYVRVHPNTRLQQLLHPEDWYGFEQEFKDLDEDRDDRVTRLEFDDVLLEHQLPKNVNDFFDRADSSGDNLVDFYEYVQARGDYDKYGNWFEDNEWDFREMMWGLDTTEITDDDLEGCLDDEGYIIDGCIEARQRPKDTPRRDHRDFAEWKEPEGVPDPTGGVIGDDEWEWVEAPEWAVELSAEDVGGAGAGGDVGGGGDGGDGEL